MVILLGRLARIPSLLLLLAAALLFSGVHSHAVTLAWDANEITPSGYELHYGTASGQYDHHIDTGTSTQQEVTGLALNQTYYFAATAYHVCQDGDICGEIPCSDGEQCVSGFSNEVEWTYLLEDEVALATNGRLSWVENEVEPVAWAYVNSGENYHEAAATTIATGAFSCTTGNALIVGVSGYRSPAPTITGIADTAGNTFTYAGRVQGLYDAGTDVELWYAENITGNASNVITATFSGSSEYKRIIAIQLSGMATSSMFDSGYTPAGNLDTTTPAVTTAANTAGDNEVIVGFYWTVTNPSTFGNSSPSVLRETIYDTAIATNDAAAQGSWSVGVASTQDAICLARAFKVAVAGGGVVIPVLMRQYMARRK